MERSYTTVLAAYLSQQRQMVFLTGPRQVGKTTLCRGIRPEAHYYNWDNADHRMAIVAGPQRIAQQTGIDILAENPHMIIFDEIHKYTKWKGFLKGFFDVYSPDVKIIVTGSSRLDAFKRGGDSLMGRYFPYRLHPLSLREIERPIIDLETEIRPPIPVDTRVIDRLLSFGGFPEPYLKADSRFAVRWKKLRQEQLFREDIRDLTRVHEIRQMEVLALLLPQMAGQLVNYSSIAARTNVAVDTARRWITALSSLYYCFLVSPWSRNIAKSLIKQPKVYLWDWTLAPDPAARAENFVASHLLKAVHWWTDNGLGDYHLHFLRDKEKREVDFLVVRNGKPWFLVEVKTTEKTVTKALHHFQEQTRAPHAFQAVFSLDPVIKDCFQIGRPIAVPVYTLLSQLV